MWESWRNVKEERLIATGLSLPEVTEVRHNEDGTIVLTIYAVCDSVVCNDAVITYEHTTVYRYEQDAAPVIIPFNDFVKVGIYDDLEICIADLLNSSRTSVRLGA